MKNHNYAYNDVSVKTNSTIPTSYNWSYTGTGSTRNWGSASGVADNVSAPVTGDDVYFDGAGAKGNTNSIMQSSYNLASLTVSSGYTSTITHTGALQLSPAISGANALTL